MIRPTVARVDLTALKSNYRHIVEHLEAEARGRAPRVIAVVKANAYGHGAAQVGLALESAGADLLACADIEEGATLRAAGVRAEILVFGARVYWTSNAVATHSLRNSTPTRAW